MQKLIHKLPKRFVKLGAANSNSVSFIWFESCFYYNLGEKGPVKLPLSVGQYVS